MGGVSGDAALSSVEIFDEAAWRWVDGAALRTGRAAACVGSLLL